VKSVVGLQAAARGVLTRRRVSRAHIFLRRSEPFAIYLQAHARGVLVRRSIGVQLAKLDDISDVIARIQAAVRTYLARKRLLALIRGLRRATPAFIDIQARARANLLRQQHKVMNKALSEVKVISSVNSFQARARAALSRKRHVEQGKRLEFVEPDVVGFQATARTALIRRDFRAWREHLWNNEEIATILQALLRGAIQRKKFQTKRTYYRDNLKQVINIQSLVRAKETREQYRQLTLGTNVSVGTIKNFVHLLDDSEADFQEEMAVEGLRKQVVQRIRENQALENDVNELDTKIALVVNNAKTFEDLLRFKRKLGGDIAAINAARASILAAHGDPFAGPSALDYSAKRKLELYQQLFYLLQTRPEYLSKLFMHVASRNVEEKTRRLIEHVVLTLFGYGQDRREDYLLLKLFQVGRSTTLRFPPAAYSTSFRVLSTRK
jgi:Ras GTPase-activating-like protein IQGAP2/3